MKHITIFLLLLTIASCKRATKDTTFLGEFSSQHACSLKELANYPVDSLGKPEYIFAKDNYIIISDVNEEYLLSSYDLSSNNFYRFLKKGNGPQELIDIQQIGLVDVNNIFIKSTFGNKLHLLGTVSSDHSYTPVIKDILPDFVSIAIDEGVIIGSGKGGHRFVISNLENREHRKEFGEAIGPFSQEMASNALQGLCVGMSGRKKIAWFSFYGEIAEFYDYSDTANVHCFKQHIGELPFVNEQYVFNKDSKLGITSLTKSDEYIFALYNGKTLEDAMNLKDLGLCSNKLLIYNWEGEPVKILNLDKKIRSISYNQQSHIMYMIGYDEDIHDYKVYYIDNINTIIDN